MLQNKYGIRNKRRYGYKDEDRRGENENHVDECECLPKMYDISAAGRICHKIIQCTVLCTIAMKQHVDLFNCFFFVFNVFT